MLPAPAAPHVAAPPAAYITFVPLKLFDFPGQPAPHAGPTPFAPPQPPPLEPNAELPQLDQYQVPHPLFGLVGWVALAGTTQLLPPPPLPPSERELKVPPPAPPPFAIIVSNRELPQLLQP